MPKHEKKIVVVTGASSGLGRATAVAFAARGDTVVLAARRKSALEQTAAACRAAGGEAFELVTDVSQESDVERLVWLTLERYGRIDVWVNNAGVALFGHLDDGSFEEHRRVLETNLFGPIYAARAVIPVFKRQHAGVMINVGSILSKVGQPYVPTYVISKFGLRGLSEALCAELADEPNIHVCSVYPYAIDTPHFQVAGNELGRRPYTMPPVQSPEMVAKAIVSLAARPQRERHVPKIAALALLLHKLAPGTLDRLLLHSLERWHFGGSQEKTEGNLFGVEENGASTHGERTPRVSTWRFAAWAAGELVQIEAQRAANAARQLRGLASR